MHRVEFRALRLRRTNFLASEEPHGLYLGPNWFNFGRILASFWINFVIHLARKRAKHREGKAKAGIVVV